VSNAERRWDDSRRLGAPRSRSDDSVREPLFRKLKPGPGHGTAEVLADQRGRLQRAMVELVAQRGYPGVTVRGLSRLAGVSTRSFYKHFANTEECFASTYESLMQCALRRASAPGEAGVNWEGDLRAGLRSLLAGLAEYPKAAHFALVDSFAAGPTMPRQMRLSACEFELLLTGAFAEAPQQAALPIRTIQGIVAGVIRVARTRLLDGRDAELAGIAGELADWLISVRSAGIADRGETATSAPADSAEDQEEQNTLFATPHEGYGDERGRVLNAVAKLAASEGYQALTAPKVRAKAGVSRRNFDAQFEDVDDCFLEAVEVLTISAATRARRRAAGGVGWERGIHQATVAFCTEIARRPALAQLAFVEILAPGRVGLIRRERLIALAAEYLRRTAPPGRRPSELAAEASVAGAWKIAQAEIVVGRGKQLRLVAPTIAGVLVASSVD
jgi:AcrR family transcriptional regulator